jgi:DNA polymerase III sliding clamp (beta) subunit (PCNA family)
MKHEIALPIAELKPALIGLGKIIQKRITLPVLGAVKIERNSAGWITLTGTNLDGWGTVRLEQPSQAEPATVLLPHHELVKISKNCGKDDSITVWSEEASGAISYPVAGQQVEHRCEAFQPDEWPPVPEIKSKPAPISDAVRASILEAFECSSDDETRYIVNGIYVDVSDPVGHHIVATDGRHLYSSNSFKLPLKEGMVLPESKFIRWGGFSTDGDWHLSTGKQGDHPYARIATRRWTFITKLVEGNYPNWRQVVPPEQDWKTRIELDAEQLAQLCAVIDRLPVHDQTNQGIGLAVEGTQLFLASRAPGSDHWTKVPVAGARVIGRPVKVVVKRSYLTKARRFGLNTIHIIDGLAPIKLSREGRQMIVMPLRYDDTSAVPEKTVSVASATALETASANSAGAQPRKEEPMPRINTPTAAPATNGNGNHTDEEPQKPALELALDQIETIKGNYREAIRGLNGLVDTLKQAQRDQRNSEKEVENVRATLTKIQQVRL